MATKAQVRAALKRQGGAWDEAYDTLDSPAGREWLASSCHAIPVIYDGPGSRAELWAGLVEQINEGTAPCADPDCEHCHE